MTDEEKTISKLLIKLNSNYLTKCVDKGFGITPINEFIIIENCMSLSRIYKNLSRNETCEAVILIDTILEKYINFKKK